jgi:hypothetical protein
MAIDGKWNVTIKSPMGNQDSTLTLETNGNVLSGSLDSPQGSAEINEGVVDGNKLSWKTTITEPMQMTLGFTATVNGDDIEGEVELGAFGKAGLSGKRA